MFAAHGAHVGIIRCCRDTQRSMAPLTMSGVNLQCQAPEIVLALAGLIACASADGHSSASPEVAQPSPMEMAETAVQLMTSDQPTDGQPINS